MGNGRRGTAPCGHEGEAIIGQFYRCLHGCDDKPADDDVDFQIVFADRCPSCKSYDSEPFSLEPIYYMYNPDLPIITSHCRNCGSCW